MLIVFLVHGIILIWMTTNHYLFTSKEKQRSLVVRTVQIDRISEKPKAICTKTPRQKVQQPIKQVVKAPALTAKKIVERSKLVKNTQIPSHAFNVAIPSILECKSKPIFIEEKDCISKDRETYISVLAHFLQNNLELPEIGEVRVRVVLKASGQPMSVEILESKNHKNSEWLKNQLPLLQAPRLSDFNINEDLIDFKILFKNK